MSIALCIVIVAYFSLMMHMGILIWQASPLKEEKSVPLYIKKEYKDLK